MSESYTEQLERESERCRAALLDSLAELRTRMTPGHVLDEVMGYTRDSSGAAFVGNLKHRAVDNPLPLALVGTGLAWLMLGGGDGRAPSDRAAAGSRPDGAYHARPDGSGGIGETASHLGDTAGDLGRRAGEAASAVGDRASSAYDSIASYASRGGSAIGDAAAAAGDRAASAAHGFGQMWRDQPLVLAGLGIAIGAALGTLLPSTDFENRAMGATRDKLKDEAEDFALRQFDKADRVADQAFDEARDAAEREGLTGEAVVGDAVDALERGNVVPRPHDPAKGGA
jgi:hypothetical protein